jgi:hypothetical protein
MRNQLLLYTIALLTSFSSCVIRKTATPVSSVNTQVNFLYDDLEYINDVTGTSSQTYLFGIIPIGGRRNHRGIFATNIINSPANVNLNKRGVNNALYDALASNPDADYIIPVSYKVESYIMPFGRKETLTIRAKALKIRPKKAEPARPQKVEIK